MPKLKNKVRKVRCAVRHGFDLAAKYTELSKHFRKIRMRK
nr:MAG TPA: hypothetical protein [Caudoviricetes sp.]